MKYSLIILFSILGISLAAQGDCYFEVDEFDDFTKERTTITVQERIAVQLDGNVHFQACYEDEDYFLRVQMALKEPWLMPSGNQVWVMLGDDNVLKINIKDDANALDATGKTSSHEATFDLDITDDQWQILKANKVTRIRFMLKDGHYDFAVKDAKAKTLQHLMNCAEKE
jgi:hypothetical protein